MTNYRFEDRDEGVVMVIADGDTAIELDEARAAEAFKAWQAHMTPIWREQQYARERAERDAVAAAWAEHQERVTIGGRDWIVQRHPEYPHNEVAAWPAEYSRQDAPVCVERTIKALGRTVARPFAVMYRQHSSYGDRTYTAEFSNARYATLDAGMSGATRNYEAAKAKSEATRAYAKRMSEKRA